jgi:predicted transcriptional regulator
MDAIVQEILLRFRGKNEKCWPSQTILAAELGVKLRCVQNLIRALAEAGEIEVERTGRNNNYWIPPRPESAHQTRTKVRIRPAQKCASDPHKSAHQTRTKVRIALEAPLDELDSAAASASAAAAASSACHDENMRALEELGMPSNVRAIAQADPDLAAVALAHFRFRFNAPRMKPIASKPGYVYRIMRDPLAWGFTKTASGEWKGPPGEMASDARAVAEKKIAAQLATRELSEEEKEEAERRMDGEDRRRAWWNHLPAETIAKVRATVRKKEPLFAHRDNEDHWFRSRCIALAESMMGLTPKETTNFDLLKEATT